jgi:hypothetical protein
VKIPISAVISKLDKWVTNNGKSQNEKWDKFKKDILPKILKRSLIAGAKVATVGALDMEKDYEKIIADFSGDITGDLIDKFNEKSQAITQFKDVIKKVLDKLSKEQKNLIIFIDELDRCRPTYAIELLERIKHLFDIERLVFILSTDTEQLCHSIRVVYGNDFDAKKYLNRFIDLDYSLKEPDLKKYIDSNLEMLSIKDYYLKQEEEKQKNYNSLLNVIFFFARRFKLKLRDVNLLITRLSLIIPSIPDIAYEYILITLLVLREQNKQLYDEYITNPETADKVISFLAQGMSENEAISGMDNLRYDFLEVFYKISAYLMICDQRNQKKIDESLLNFQNSAYFKVHYVPEKITSINNHMNEIAKSFALKKTREQVDYSYDAIQRIKTIVQYTALIGIFTNSFFSTSLAE